MDIHKFGKAPSLTARLHKNNIWQTWGVSLACMQEKWMIYLAPERRPCFLFVQAKFKWGVNENIQGKDVQAASERNVFTGTWLPILRIPFSADHFMDIKKNIFWGARSFVVPNLVHKRRQKSMFKITLPWKGVSPIWKGPNAYLVFLTTSIRIHKPMSDPCMFSIAGFFAVVHTVSLAGWRWVFVGVSC